MVLKVKCLLIHPKFSEFSALNYVEVCKIVGTKYPCPPLGLITVAALLPQNWEFKLIDMNVEELLDQHFIWADIICTGGMISQQLGIISIIEKAHKFGKRVLVGGPEPTSQPQLYTKADYLFIGEGETTINTFLQDFHKGAIRGKYISPQKADLTSTAIPRYDLIKQNNYLMMGIQFSRGCPYECEYCNVVEIFGRKVRAKEVSHVIAELQTLFDLGYRGHVFFVDDNFFANRKKTEELLNKMNHWSVQHGFPFYYGAEVTINLANDDELLSLVKGLDFRYLSIGIETVDNILLANAGKFQNVDIPIVETIRKINSYGIVADASFILGFDDETDDIADSMIKCIQESGICMAMVGTLCALPNTQLVKRLKAEKRLNSEETKIQETDIDQMSSGLNFVTTRPKTQILRDYNKIISYLYNPDNYYDRLTRTGLSLNRQNKYKPKLSESFNVLKAFTRLSLKAGFNRRTGLLYWKLFFTILFNNPKALELVLGMAAMYIHFWKHSQFIIRFTEERIVAIETLEKTNNIID